MDMLVYETHKIDYDTDKPVCPFPVLTYLTPLSSLPSQLRYTDSHTLAQARGISLKCSPMSLVLQTSKGKSHLINIIDTPGHANFQVSRFAALS